MGRTTKKRKSKDIPLKKSKWQEAAVEKKRYTLRRYEQCHDKFLNYEGIKQYLCKIHRNYPSKVQIQVIGRSSAGRSIFLVIISDSCSSTQPKMATMIEAGANGCDWMAISSALFMIDFLAKNQNLVKIMDYFIIPCSNPDACECGLANKSSASMNLTNNYPVLLGTCDMRSINTKDFLGCIKEWKENYKCNSPETLALLKTIVTYQFATKLFISLQSDGNAIMYPNGYCATDISDVDDLKKVAKAGQAAIRSRCFSVGSIYNVCGLTYGTIIDFLRANRSSIKFTYIIHVDKSQKKDPSKILTYGEEMMNCVRFMAKHVYMFYNKSAAVNGCKSSFGFIFSTYLEEYTWRLLIQFQSSSLLEEMKH